MNNTFLFTRWGGYIVCDYLLPTTFLLLVLGVRREEMRRMTRERAGREEERDEEGGNEEEKGDEGGDEEGRDEEGGDEEGRGDKGGGEEERKKGVTREGMRNS